MAIARPRGVERIRLPQGIEPAAKVTDGIVTFEIRESQYRRDGYQPEFDELPWRGESKLLLKITTPVVAFMALLPMRPTIGVINELAKALHGIRALF